MIASNPVSFFNQIVNSPFPLLLALLICSVAVIPISDWYSKGRMSEWESSVRELEALFTLRDPR